MTVQKCLFCLALLSLTSQGLVPATAQDATIPDSSVFFELGAGVVWGPSDRSLTAFDQAVRFGPGADGKVGAGVVVKPGPEPLLIELGIDAYFDELSPGLVVNTLTPGSLSVEGFSRAFSLAPRIGLSGDIVPGTQWVVGAGGGIAFQSLELRTAGGPIVLSGSGTTLMGHVDVGLRHEVAPCVFLGAEAYANFYGGYDVHTSTNVVSPLGPTVQTGVRATLRILPGIASRPRGIDNGPFGNASSCKDTNFTPPLSDSASEQGVLATGAYSIQNDPGAIGFLTQD